MWNSNDSVGVEGVSLENLLSPFSYGQEVDLPGLNDSKALKLNINNSRGFVSQDCLWGCSYNRNTIICFPVDTNGTSGQYVNKSHTPVTISTSRYQFQAASIACATELAIHNQKTALGISKVLIGLRVREHEGNLLGALIIFDPIRGLPMKWISLPSPVTSVAVLSHYEEGGITRPFFSEAMLAMVGVAAVGMQGGRVLVVDLGLDDPHLTNWDNISSLSHSTRKYHVTPVDSHELLIAMKRHNLVTKNNLICIDLSIEPDEDIEPDSGYFFYCNPDKTVINALEKSSISVTSLEFIPAIGSLIVGFNFGGFQIWRVDNANLIFSAKAPPTERANEVFGFAFQQPVDDPKNFSFLWVLYGKKTLEMHYSHAELYGLLYNEKPYVENFGQCYDGFNQCIKRLTIRLEDYFDSASDNEDSEVEQRYPSQRYSVRPIRIWSQSDHLTFLSWESNRNGIYYVGIFDLNQWYSSHTSDRIRYSSIGLCPYWVAIPIETIERFASVWDVGIVPKSIERWENPHAKLDVHLYPASITFRGVCLSSSGTSSFEFFGVQEKLLRVLQKNGPDVMVEPSQIRNMCQMYGLQPVITHDYEELAQQEADRYFILSILLETRSDDLNDLKFALEKFVQYSAALLMFHKAGILPEVDENNFVPVMLNYYESRRMEVKGALQNCDFLDPEIKSSHPLLIDCLLEHFDEKLLREHWNLEPDESLYPPKHIGYILNMFMWVHEDPKAISRVIAYYLIDLSSIINDTVKLRGDFASIIQLSTEEQTEIYNLWALDHGSCHEVLLFLSQKERLHESDGLPWCAAVVMLTALGHGESIVELLQKSCPSKLGRLYFNLMTTSSAKYKFLIDDICSSAALMEQSHLQNFFEVSDKHNLLGEFVKAKSCSAPQAVTNALVEYLERHSNFENCDRLLSFYVHKEDWEKLREQYNIMKIKSISWKLSGHQRSVWQIRQRLVESLLKPTRLDVHSFVSEDSPIAFVNAPTRKIKVHHVKRHYTLPSPGGITLARNNFSFDIKLPHQLRRTELHEPQSSDPLSPLRGRTGNLHTIFVQNNETCDTTPKRNRDRLLTSAATLFTPSPGTPNSNNSMDRKSFFRSTSRISFASGRSPINLMSLLKTPAIDHRRSVNRISLLKKTIDKSSNDNDKSIYGTPSAEQGDLNQVQSIMKKQDSMRKMVCRKGLRFSEYLSNTSSPEDVEMEDDTNSNEIEVGIKVTNVEINDKDTAHLERKLETCLESCETDNIVESANNNFIQNEESFVIEETKLNDSIAENLDNHSTILEESSGDEELQIDDNIIESENLQHIRDEPTKNKVQLDAQHLNDLIEADGVSQNPEVMEECESEKEFSFDKTQRGECVSDKEIKANESKKQMGVEECQHDESVIEQEVEANKTRMTSENVKTTEKLCVSFHKKVVYQTTSIRGNVISHEKMCFEESELTETNNKTDNDEPLPNSKENNEEEEEQMESCEEASFTDPMNQNINLGDSELELSAANSLSHKIDNDSLNEAYATPNMSMNDSSMEDTNIFQDTNKTIWKSTFARLRESDASTNDVLQEDAEDHYQEAVSPSKQQHENREPHRHGKNGTDTEVFKTMEDLVTSVSEGDQEGNSQLSEDPFNQNITSYSPLSDFSNNVSQSSIPTEKNVLVEEAVNVSDRTESTLDEQGTLSVECSNYSLQVPEENCYQGALVKSKINESLMTEEEVSVLEAENGSDESLCLTIDASASIIYSEDKTVVEEEVVIEKPEESNIL